MRELSSPIGIIAGSGNFPMEFARNAKEKGLKVFAIGHIGETDPALEKIATHFHWVKVGQLGKILSLVKRSGVKQLVFTGGISRIKLFKNTKLDLKLLALIAKTGSVKDDVILRAIAGEIEKLGVEVISSSVLLDKSLAKKGVLTKRALNNEERKNAMIGWNAAKSLGAIDAGQTAVVSKGLVVALECVEGTDVAILRGGAFSNGEGSVVVKVAKPQQDLRLDLPSVGIKTIESMIQAKATALILEHERALILDPDAVVRKANQAGIAIGVVEQIDELQ